MVPKAGLAWHARLPVGLSQIWGSQLSAELLCHTFGCPLGGSAVKTSRHGNCYYAVAELYVRFLLILGCLYPLAEQCESAQYSLILIP
jgi:hypothetical protein